jgi:hypothetical protein
LGTIYKEVEGEISAQENSKKDKQENTEKNKDGR